MSHRDHPRREGDSKTAAQREAGGRVSYGDRRQAAINAAAAIIEAFTR